MQRGDEGAFSAPRVMFAQRPWIKAGMGDVAAPPARDSDLGEEFRTAFVNRDLILPPPGLARAQAIAAKNPPLRPRR